MGIANPRPAMRRREERIIHKRLRVHTILINDFTRDLKFSETPERISYLAMVKVRELTEAELDAAIKTHAGIGRDGK